MTNNNQTERVSDDELDQMIWKLERDGMNPKLLSLMRELLEVRRAKGEPVAVINGAREPVLYGEHIGIAIGTHLYAAPPLPVPSNIPPEKPHTDGSLADGWNACRAAMLQAGNSPATPDGWVLVPEDPTHEMLEAGDAQFGTYDVYRRMIEAAPKEVG
ncbi:TPA: hypothetical protein ACG1DO_003488 [Kluyvera ascorbata]